MGDIVFKLFGLFIILLTMKNDHKKECEKLNGSKMMIDDIEIHDWAFIGSEAFQMTDSSGKHGYFMD